MSKEYLEAFKIVYNNFDYLISDVVIENDDVNICLKTIKEQLPTIKQALQRLESIEKGKNTDIIDNYMAFKNDNSNPSEALECLERIDKEYLTIESKDFDNCFNTIKQALLKAQEQEKENELLKEIIKSLFDRGCPLHQYTDKEGVLTIEVDSECSIMRIGIYKGVDLDKTLKEVLKWFLKCDHW